jgi:hypothetical protein
MSIFARSHTFSNLLQNYFQPTRAIATPAARPQWTTAAADVDVAHASQNRKISK